MPYSPKDPTAATATANRAATARYDLDDRRDFTDVRTCAAANRC